MLAQKRKPGCGASLSDLSSHPKDKSTDVEGKEINFLVGANVVPNDVIEFASDGASSTVAPLGLIAVITRN
jgi:hypothetical protein